MLVRKRLVVPLAVVALTAVGCGSSKSAASHDLAGMSATMPPAVGSATRTVDLTMADIRFEPSQLAVRKGETVRLVFHNQGKLEHEATIGDAGMQAAHEQEMATSSGSMNMHDSGAVTVAAGATGELTHTFTETGSVLIGCHEPGHYAAGMKVDVFVS